MMRPLSIRIGLALLLCCALCAMPLYGQNAKTLRAQAETEANQEKQVLLLCKAADLEPKNAEYRKDCDISRSALISADRQSLKTAQDAFDNGQVAKAKRYGNYVSSLDPELHRQAQQLLVKLDAPLVVPHEAGDPLKPQKDMLAQASAAFQAGNLPAAKSAAQGVTDASLKPVASQIVADIDRYNGLVAAGQQQEQQKKYTEAVSSYQAAQAINAHVPNDNLAGHIQGAQQAATAASAAAAAAAAAAERSHQQAANTVASGTQDKKPPVESPEDRKRRLLIEAKADMDKHEWEMAAKVYKQVQAIDPSNAEAKNGLDQTVAALAAALKDPVLLEKTLREAIVAFYASDFEVAESRFNRYLGREGGRQKGAAYFYLGATEVTLAMLDDASKRASRTRDAREDFKQARQAGYQPIDRYVSARVLGVWNGGGL